MKTIYSETAFDHTVKDLDLPSLVKEAAIIYEDRAFGNSSAIHNGVCISDIGNTAIVFSLDYRETFVRVEIELNYGTPAGLTRSESILFHELTPDNYHLGSEVFDLINIAYNGNLHFGAVGISSQTQVAGDVFGPYIMSQTLVKPMGAE